MFKRWNYVERPDQPTVDVLVSALNIDEVLASLLIQRGKTDYNSAKSFFRPELKSLHDPFLMKDMQIAVDRLITAIKLKEKILIYGDYDVDGTTSVSMMMSLLGAYHSKLFYYIPDRYSEGYGISLQGIDWAKAHNINLMISLDCGIKAMVAIAKAHDYGIDVIVCDHHRPGDSLPNAFAILDPKRSDCSYPYKELSGCGVGFKLLQGYVQQMNLPEGNLWQLLDLVAVSIASDIVPVTEENRVLAYFGMEQLNKNPRPGLQALMHIGNMKLPTNITSVVFGIAPRINAAGRIAHAHSAVELLNCKDVDEAIRLASLVNSNNEIRKETDRSITAEALDMIRVDRQLAEAKTTVLYREDWHKGVIGIVASKCIEHFHRPTIILTRSNGKATGSARSVPGFDIHEAIGACGELLEQFGGHKYAAGLTLPLKNIKAFQKKFEEVVATTIQEDQMTPQITIDMEILLESISDNFLRIINQMEPFGPGNMRPVFVTKNLTAIEPKLLKGLHLKMKVVDVQDGLVFDAIGFNMPEYIDKISQQEPFHLAYTLEMNNFRGKKTIQLMIKDIKFG